MNEADQASLPSPETQLPRIIVVDDDLAVGHLMAMVLEEIPAEVNVYPLIESLPDLSRRHPALLVLDVNLPITDGISFFRRVRADPDLADVPVIFTTVSPWIVEQEIPDRAGRHVDVLQKPFDIMELQVLARRVLVP
jgi:putative two-component system response regulator